MKTVFEHKPDFTFREFAVEKTVTIPARKLEEMLRVIDRELPGASRETLLVLDAVTGQNALVQAEQFNQAADLTGLVITKLDGTAKGGVAINVSARLGTPIKFIGVGETADDLLEFDPAQFVQAFFES